MFAYQWFCFPDLVLPLSNDGAKLSCKNPKMSECAKTVTNFLCSCRLTSYDKTRNPTIMSRNKAIWIAKLLFRRGQLSREEILAAWASCDENAKPMAPSTFYDNRHLLWERYGINIRVSHGLYSLDLREGREQEFLNQLFYDDEGYDNSDTVIREPRPAGYVCIAAISRAMDSHTCVEAVYSPFDKPKYSLLLAPYCLRVFRGRCYVVGFSSAHREVRTFALDRMESLQPTPHPFPHAPKFDAKQYFANSFGVYGGADRSPEHIVLEADALNASFLRTLPLHSSQKETKTDADGGKYVCRFELDICISPDFVHELLYHGAGIRVVSPEHLRREIKNVAKKILEA